MIGRHPVALRVAVRAAKLEVVSALRQDAVPGGVLAHAPARGTWPHLAVLFAVGVAGAGSLPICRWPLVRVAGAFAATGGGRPPVRS
jgi:hypothetical protein